MDFFASDSFTLIHVIISLIGIATGLIVLREMIGNKKLGTTNVVFLVTTILTSVTGFLFPFKGFDDPAIIVGIISLVALAIAVLALYRGLISEIWRPAFTITATFALYLNVFVAIVQSFQKISFLKAPDPTQPTPAFLVVQAAGVVVFLVLGFLATRRFHPPA
jgi:hypothetical protein